MLPRHNSPGASGLGVFHCHTLYPNLLKPDMTGNIPRPHDSCKQGTLTILPHASPQIQISLSSPFQAIAAATSRPSHQSKDNCTWCFLNPLPELRTEIKGSLLPPGFKPVPRLQHSLGSPVQRQTAPGSKPALSQHPLRLVLLIHSLFSK